MTNFTPEMIEKAKAAKTAEELMALAKENNVEMTAVEAKAYYAQINPASGELADDELDNVAGGGCGGGGETPTVANNEPQKYFNVYYDGARVTSSPKLCCSYPDGHCSSYIKGKIHFFNSVQWELKCESCGRTITRDGNPADAGIILDI